MFCDNTRDAIKGHCFYAREAGYVNGRPDMFPEIRAAVTAWCCSDALPEHAPGQIVSYVSAHDNYTLWDKLLLVRTDFIRGIRSQTDKLDFLFQALVKTSRLETGVIQLDKKPGRLFDTVAQAMSGIVYAAEKKEIAVSVDCPEDLTVSHDSKWTSEALFNLLDNAVKYTPAGGKIAVSVVLWEMYVEIKVTDTGKGISESNQATIFQRFYREEEVHEQQGVGIGLYLAREIVTRQGGYIKVVSEPGKGSEFSIMLPLR